MTNKEIGSRIKERRLELSLTLQDIATEIGVARSTIQRYENGAIENLKLPVVEAIARVLKVEPSWILGKSTEAKKAPTQEGEREITFDDFTYAMQNESKELTDGDKQILLSLAKQLNDARKKRNGESG